MTLAVQPQRQAPPEARDDFLLPEPIEREVEFVPMDKAVDAAMAKRGLPLLGGPSGHGWSYYGVAQRCPELLRARYYGEGAREHPHDALQLGGLFHTLLALFYGAGIAAPRPTSRGLVAAKYERPLASGRPRPRVHLPLDAADQLLAELYAVCDAATGPGQGPDKRLVLQAERLFGAHVGFYDHGEEDVEPLAVEFLAAHPDLDYTCRYDCIARVGERDPRLPPGVVIFERKSAAWLYPSAKDGWFLDGEILGQILLWKPSGCEERFGPLVGVVVDVITKGKVPEAHRVLVPTESPSVWAHEAAIRLHSAMINIYRATGRWPRNFAHCIEAKGSANERRCPRWEACRANE